MAKRSKKSGSQKKQKRILYRDAKGHFCAKNKAVSKTTVTTKKSLKQPVRAGSGLPRPLQVSSKTPKKKASKNTKKVTQKEKELKLIAKAKKAVKEQKRLAEKIKALKERVRRFSLSKTDRRIVEATEQDPEFLRLEKLRKETYEKIAKETEGWVNPVDPELTSIIDGAICLVRSRARMDPSALDWFELLWQYPEGSPEFMRHVNRIALETGYTVSEIYTLGVSP